eukprot:UN05283
METRILDVDGNEVERHQNNTSINLKIRDLLKYGGLTLDDKNYRDMESADGSEICGHTLEHVDCEQDADYPYLRLTGVNINLRIEFHYEPTLKDVNHNIYASVQIDPIETNSWARRNYVVYEETPVFTHGTTHDHKYIDYAYSNSNR